jgi:hypothetical protein
MKFEDLLLKKVPLTMNKKIVANTFIKQISVKNMSLLTAFQKKQTEEEMINSSLALIKVSLVDKDDNLLMGDKEELALDNIMEITNQIIEVNTPKGK